MNIYFQNRFLLGNFCNVKRKKSFNTNWYLLKAKLPTIKYSIWLVTGLSSVITLVYSGIFGSFHSPKIPSSTPGNNLYFLHNNHHLNLHRLIAQNLMHSKFLQSTVARLKKLEFISFMIRQLPPARITSYR